jgi:hypothetical protein
VVAAAVLSAPQSAPPAGSRVAPLFDPASPDRSPFPSDRYTVSDDRQITGRRVNLPMPADCAARASDCEDVAVLNQLDGFNLEPRISIPFSGAIDPRGRRPADRGRAGLSRGRCAAGACARGGDRGRVHVHDAEHVVPAAADPRCRARGAGAAARLSCRNSRRDPRVRRG